MSGEPIAHDDLGFGILGDDRASGSAKVDAPAPFDAMPVYVRVGSIVPFGPELQYTGKSPPTPSPFTCTAAPMAPSPCMRIRA
jgi:alpha-glucosidase (family GH31 glycosyl hydrolase)